MIVRRNKFNENFPLLAEGFAKRGLNDKEIAKKLGISGATYYDYLKRYPEFLEAVKRGKAPIDDEVENILLQKIRGIKYTETRTEYKPSRKLSNGQMLKRRVISVTKTKKFIPPCTSSIQFHLRNRRPDDWNKERTGVDVTVKGSLSIKEMKENVKAAEKSGSK